MFTLTELFNEVFYLANRISYLLIKADGNPTIIDSKDSVPSFGISGMENSSSFKKMRTLPSVSG